MPSGAKKRKAAKKKMRKGEAHDSNNHHHHHSNSSSTHSHGNDDPKSVDDKESDSGELEREEEEEKGDAGGKLEILDQQEGDTAKDEGLEEEIVRVEVESKPPEHGSGSTDFTAVYVAKETPIVVLASEDSVPGNDGVVDKDVTVVEEEKSVIAGCGELKGQDASSALVCVPGDEIPKAFDYVPAKADGVGGASVEDFNKSVEERILNDELVKEVVTLAQEVNPGAESLVISDVIGSELMKNADSVSQLPDDKEKLSLATQDRQLQKIETQVVPIDKDKSLDAPAVNTSSGMGAVETLETGKQLEEQVLAPATTRTQVVDSIKNGETHMQSHDHVGVTVSNTSREVDNGKELEAQKQSEEQPLIGSNPLPVRRTSWMGCCGLFEVFSGVNR